MNFAAARQVIAHCREQMDTLYQKPVFDEWVLLLLERGAPKILFYQGPRPDSYQKRLHSDSAALAREMQDNTYAVGDFEFAPDARGSRFDAAVRIGEHTYLWCNNTYGTINDLRQDVRWLKAQKPFVELTEKFRADPFHSEAAP